MVGLLDIAPLTEKVAVGGQNIDVVGVSAAGIVSLIARYPEVKMLMAGKEVDVGALMAIGGDAVAALIAASVGYPGDEKQEAAAAKLSLQVQMDILAAAIRVTIGPNGIGPFLEKLTAMVNIKEGAEALARVRGTKSPKR